MFNIIYDQSRRCEYSKCKKKKKTDLINFLLVSMLQIESVNLRFCPYTRIRASANPYFHNILCSGRRS